MAAVGLDAASPGRAVPLQRRKPKLRAEQCERDFASGKEREGVRRGRQCAETIEVPKKMLAIHLCFAAGVGASVAGTLNCRYEYQTCRCCAYQYQSCADFGASGEVLGTLSVLAIIGAIPTAVRRRP